MANFMAHGPRPRPPPRSARAGCPARRAARTSRVPASTRATRRTSRSPARSTSSGSRPTTLVVLPADDDFHLRGAPVAAAIARDRAAGLTPVRDRGGRRLDEHGFGRRHRRARRRRRRPKDCGCTSTRRMAAERGCRRAIATGSRVSIGPTRVTVDPHKWFFQAYDIGGLLVRDGGDAARPCSADARPSTTAVARRPGRGAGRPAGRRPDDGHEAADQLNFYKLSFEGTRRWRALKLWMSWKHLGTLRLRAAHRGQRRPRRVPRAPLRGVPTTSRRCRRSRSSRSCASGTSRPGSRAQRSMPTRIASRQRSNCRVTDGSPRRDCVGRPGCAQGCSTTSRPRRTSTTCSKRSGPSPRRA